MRSAGVKAAVSSADVERLVEMVSPRQDKLLVRRGPWAVGAAILLVGALAAAWMAGGPWSASGSVSHRDKASTRLFSPNGVWNHTLADNARIDPHSPKLVNRLVNEVNRERNAGTGPWIQTDSYSTPLYVVGPHQPRVHVTLFQGNSAGRRSLQHCFNRVPIPPRAKPAAGSDAHMVVWQPSTDMLWEFFAAHKQNGRWHAIWGGAMKNVSSKPGYYTRNSWPGRSLLNWGATASSLSVIGGVMLIKELKGSRIPHALAMIVPSPRARQYSWPAQRTDGGGPANALPEGARLRLPANLNLTSMHLPRIVLMMARAAKAHGIIVARPERRRRLLRAGPGSGRRGPLLRRRRAVRRPVPEQAAREVPLGQAQGAEDEPLHRPVAPLPAALAGPEPTHPPGTVGP